VTNQVLYGSLSHFGLTPVLRLLQAARATGRLELEHGDERTELFIEDGRSLFARTTGSAPRIGDLLVRRGDLRPEAIEFALAIQRDQPEERLGRMLVKNGVLTAEQIHSAVLEVQRHIVLAALRWRSGAFRFGPEERLAGEDIRLELDVDELLTWVLTAADSPLDCSEDARAA
jgi:hypothetical protein